MKLVKLLANLGYGSRKQVTAMFREGLVTDLSGEVLYTDDKIEPDQILVEGEPLDPAPGFIIAMNKPLGYTCSTKDPSRLVYDLLPPRFRLRDPSFSTVGRLDRETSGLLLMTDDGQLLHRIISPKSNVSKVYEVTLAEPLRGDEGALFASGTMMLESEHTPLAPAHLDVLEPQKARLTVTEGRYHQVRRMFAATGNAVVTLERVAVGALTLADSGLKPGEWRALTQEEIALIFS